MGEIARQPNMAAATAAKVISKLVNINRILKEVKPGATASEIADVLRKRYPRLGDSNAFNIADRIFKFAAKHGYGVTGGEAATKGMVDAERMLKGAGGFGGGVTGGRRKRGSRGRRRGKKSGGAVAVSQSSLGL